MRRVIMVTCLVVLLITLVGSLGGIALVLVKKPSYQAAAYVVVYEMPNGFRELIGPDEANQIEADYRAGALQDAVIQRVLQRIHGQTATGIRANVQVSIVAYTPLTRVTATAANPTNAALLANVVASAWADVAGHAYATAYTSTHAQMTTHESQLTTQIASVQKQIDAYPPGSGQTPGLIALQSQLKSLLQERVNLDNQLSQLETDQLALSGNAYVATPATPQSATLNPSPSKTIGTGAALGLALGVVLALWLLRQRLRKMRLALDLAPTHAPEAQLPVA